MMSGIAFLYPTVDQAAKNERNGGTGFLVAIRAPKTSEALGFNASIPFLVSNRHVVRNSGCSVARFNRRDGGMRILDIDPAEWTVHPDGDDVAAVCVLGALDRDVDDISAAEYTSLISEEMAKTADIGVGDEVWMMGRFINHQGRERIQPAVRFGNISMAPELIPNRAIGRGQLSWAVEMRSRTGFSGSPVITYRVPGAPSLKDLPEGHEVGWGVLGINWGHILDEDGENTWLNGVVPSWKIRELLESPKLKADFMAGDEMVANQAKSDEGVEPSVAVKDIEPPATDDNPQHKEDFNRLLNAAASDRTEGSET